MTSTCDVAEGITTPPPESDMDDEKIQEREASADRSRVYHSFRENSVLSSSHIRDSAGKPAAMFSHERKSSQETLSDRKHFLMISTSSRKGRNFIQVL